MGGIDTFTTKIDAAWCGRLELRFMKLSRLARNLTTLALALAIAASSTLSTFALWVPDYITDGDDDTNSSSWYDDDYDDDEDEDDDDDDYSYGTSSLRDAIIAKRDDADDDDDDKKTTTTTSKKTSSSSGKIVIIKKDGSKVTAGSSSSTSGKKSDDVEIVSASQSGGKVIPTPGSKKTTTTTTTTTSKKTSSTTSSGTTTSTSAATTSKLASTIKNAQKTYNNTDIKGWLKIGGTNIDYGVVKTSSGKGIGYYEALGYDKKYSKNGVLWTNSTTNYGTSSTLAKNTVIFGHNWTNSWKYGYSNRAKDVMFAQMVAFKHLDFAKKNQKITFATEKEDMTFQIFAVFICNADKFNYVTANPTAKSHQKVIDEARSLSFFDYDTDVDSNDKIITLSTCIDAYYKNGVRQTNQRLVIMGKLVKGDEATKNVTVTTNKVAKTPTF